MAVYSWGQDDAGKHYDNERLQTLPWDFCYNRQFRPAFFGLSLSYGSALTEGKIVKARFGESNCCVVF